MRSIKLMSFGFIVLLLSSPTTSLTSAVGENSQLESPPSADRTPEDNLSYLEQDNVESYQEAIEKLEHDILEKLDADGKADWVKQPMLITEVRALIAILLGKQWAKT